MRVQVDSTAQQVYQDEITIEIDLALTAKSLFDLDMNLLDLGSEAFEATAKQIREFIERNWVGDPEPSRVVISKFIIPQNDRGKRDTSDICVCPGDKDESEIEVYVRIQFYFQIPLSQRGLAKYSVEAITALIRHNLLLIKAYVNTFVHESERFCVECIKSKSGVL